MDVKIVMSTYSEGEISLNSCEDENHIWITCVENKNELSVKVSIEELKHAIRKLSAR